MTPERRRELHSVFLDTDYWVDGPTCRFAIRVGKTEVALDELLFDDCVFDWAFITACNPYSQRFSVEKNATRMRHLVADLSVAGHRFYPGEGSARNGDWPPEPSVLIVGIAPNEALKIAKRYGQLAIVCGRAAEPARLVWTDLDTTTPDRII